LEREILEAAASLMTSCGSSVHGFALAQAMRTDSGSRSLVSHGTLYKALGRLEEFGLLNSRWEDAPTGGRPRRRLYELTGAGVEAARTSDAPALVRPSRVSPRPI
jgi:PadR family transcriptional regulator PadR